ncbi:MAG: MarR family transcriptional regulator [Dehalococcoidia bacterium]|jgi:DNA-binding MarR family transcriptional regulator
MNSSDNITISAKHREDSLDRVSENILQFFPLFYKNILKLAHGNNRVNPITMQLRVLIMLTHAGMMQPSDIGIRMGISKPNVSALIDKLIVLGHVERRPDEKDRRVIHIAITARGRRFVANRLQQVRKGIKNNLSGLDHVELDSLNMALDTFNKIISKMSQM